MDQSVLRRHQIMYNILSDYEILRVQLRPIVDFFSCYSLNKIRRHGPEIFKFLRRHQDMQIQQDENRVFWPRRFKNYSQKHIFHQLIQDNVKRPDDNGNRQVVENDTSLIITGSN
jgi:hypothetical protein